MARDRFYVPQPGPVTFIRPAGESWVSACAPGVTLVRLRSDPRWIGRIVDRNAGSFRRRRGGRRIYVHWGGDTYRWHHHRDLVGIGGPRRDPGPPGGVEMHDATIVTSVGHGGDGGTDLGDPVDGRRGNR